MNGDFTSLWNSRFLRLCTFSHPPAAQCTSYTGDSDAEKQITSHNVVLYIYVLLIKKNLLQIVDESRLDFELVFSAVNKLT